MAYSYHNTILNNVYNYYQSDFSTRSSSRYDAHKRSDLKNVYKSIVNMSKDSPVFLLKDARAMQAYSIHMKESALNFRESVGALGGLDDSTMFEKRTVLSSDPDVVDAEGLRVEEDDSLEITVEALATSQTNTGTYLSNTSVGLAFGAYSFDVTTATSNYELQFNIGANDTNRSIQERLARLINHSNLGLTASVSINNEDKSALIISSSRTGLPSDGQPAFLISDENTSQTQGIVDYLGIRDISTPAQDAHYTINGESLQSPTNSFFVGGKYSIRLKGTGGTKENPITIGVKPDYESLKDNIISLTGAYNNFLEATAKYLDKHPRTSLLIGSMKQLSSGYTSAFHQMGISQENNGTLSVDKEQLSNALQNPDIKESLISLKQFTGATLKKAEQIQLNPLNYIDKPIVAYKNPNVSHYANPYITSAYSGLFFNSYM